MIEMNSNTTHDTSINLPHILHSREIQVSLEIRRPTLPAYEMREDDRRVMSIDIR